MSRWVIVDDNDLSVNYTGPWFADRDSQSTYGEPLYGTLHETNASASFSYSFNGSQVIVFGYMQNSSSFGEPPTWECLVDGIGIPPPLSYDPTNRWPICKQDTLTDGSHTITVNAKARVCQSFSFDYIQYLPSASVPLDNATVYIGSTDPEMEYGPGWQTLPSGNMTRKTNSTCTFLFNGISLTWVGFISSSFPFAPTTATYAIDGQAPVNFKLNGLRSNATQAVLMFSQIFFETPLLPTGQHRLDVVYQGNSETTPLTLEGVIVQNNTSNSPSNAPSSGSGGPSIIPTTFPTTSSQPSTDSTSENNAHQLNSLLGGLIGGLAFFVFLLAVFSVFFFYRRRHNKNLMTKNAPPNTTSFTGKQTSSITGNAFLRSRGRSSSMSSQSSYSAYNNHPLQTFRSGSGYWNTFAFDSTSHISMDSSSGIREAVSSTRTGNPLPKNDQTLKLGRQTSLPLSPSANLHAYRALRQLEGLQASSTQHSGTSISAENSDAERAHAVLSSNRDNSTAGSDIYS